ncbi:MAG: hypothetical protein EA415_03670 [Sphaerobacteraceae bacterium]|nr:MAG: hypothetical protein EA415_03670 [Sphaerobacteraceae bacterium]
MQVAVKRKWLVDSWIHAAVRQRLSKILTERPRPLKMINMRTSAPHDLRWERDRFTSRMLSSWDR